MTGFLDFPGELRDRIYELCLLHHEPIEPWTGYNSELELTLGLLRVNKTVYREASSWFYAQNCFDLTMATPEDVAIFLRRIGRNADFVQHVRVDFPSLRDLEPSNVTLEEDSSDIFAHIQSLCANLQTLTISLGSTNAMVLKLDALDHPKIVIEALMLVNSRFRAMTSLQNIIVEVYEDSLSDYLKRIMESHGWTVREEEHIVDWGVDRFFGDDDWDHDYGYSDDDDGDDYDIDNDSDFWRRAGD